MFFFNTTRTIFISTLILGLTLLERRISYGVEFILTMLIKKLMSFYYLLLTYFKLTDKFYKLKSCQTILQIYNDLLFFEQLVCIYSLVHHRIKNTIIILENLP